VECDALPKAVLTGDTAMVIMGESDESEWSVTLTMLRDPIPANRPHFQKTEENTDHPGRRGGPSWKPKQSHSPQEMMHSLVIAISMDAEWSAAAWTTSD